MTDLLKGKNAECETFVDSLQVRDEGSLTCELTDKTRHEYCPAAKAWKQICDTIELPRPADFPMKSSHGGEVTQSVLPTRNPGFNFKSLLDALDAQTDQVPA